jgi:hypothetical protein
MDDRMGLLMAWLGEEGERQRRRIPLPPQVGDRDLRGWVQVGVCALTGIVVLGVLTCWLGPAWDLAGRSARLSEGSFGWERGITLQCARVEKVAWGAGTGGRSAALILIVSQRGLLALCEFQVEKVPRQVRVGETISIRGHQGRLEETISTILVTDCEMVEEPPGMGEE